MATAQSCPCEFASPHSEWLLHAPSLDTASTGPSDVCIGAFRKAACNLVFRLATLLRSIPPYTDSSRLPLYPSRPKNQGLEDCEGGRNATMAILYEQNSILRACAVVPAKYLLALTLTHRDIGDKILHVFLQVRFADRTFLLA